MARVKVQLADNIKRVVTFDSAATEGATLGTNVYLNGAVASAEAIRTWLGLGPSGSAAYKNGYGITISGGNPKTIGVNRAADFAWQGQHQWGLPLWGPDGTAAVPALTFTSDPDTGIYRLGANNLAISTGGAIRWDVNNSRTLQHIPHYVGINVTAPATNFPVARYYNSNNPPLNGGLSLDFSDGAPIGDDLSVSLGFWYTGDVSAMTDAAPSSNARGFRLIGSGNAATLGRFNFQRYHLGTAATVWSVESDRTALQLADGSASVPIVCFASDTDCGFYYDAATRGLILATDGAFVLGVRPDSVRLNQPALANDGTASNPSYSFATQTTLGMYRVGAGVLGFSTASALRLQISGATITAFLKVSFPDGSVGAPALTFNSDGDTGFYWVASNTFAAVVNGGETLRFGPAGQLGLGGANYGSAGQAIVSAGVASAAVYGTVGALFGGTGFTSYAAGDIIYASAANVLAKLGAGADGDVLTLSGGLPIWSVGGGGGGGSGGLVYVNTSVPGGNTVANTVAETAFTSSYDIPADQLQPGSVVRLRFDGVLGTDAIPPTLRIRVKLDSTTVLDSGAVTLAGALTNEGWSAQASLVCFTDGATGTVDAQGVAVVALSAVNSQVIPLENASTATIDTTVDQTITVTVEWGAADTDNTVTLRQLQVDILDAVTPTAAAPATLTYLTEDNEAVPLPNSRRVLAGSGIAFDDSVANARTTNYAPEVNFRLMEDFLLPVATSTATGTAFVSSRDPIGYTSNGTIAAGVYTTDMIMALTLTNSSVGNSNPQVFLYPPRHPLNTSGFIYRYKARAKINRTPNSATNPVAMHFGWKDMLSGVTSNHLYVQGSYPTEATGAMHLMVNGVNAGTIGSWNMSDFDNTIVTVEIIADPASGFVYVFMDGVLELSYNAGAGAGFTANSVAPMARYQITGAAAPANVMHLDYILEEIRLAR